MSNLTPEQRAKLWAECFAISTTYAGDIPDWQHSANADFFLKVWDMLKVGGVYGYLAVGVLLKKTPDGWEEVT